MLERRGRSGKVGVARKESGVNIWAEAGHMEDIVYATPGDVEAILNMAGTLHHVVKPRGRDQGTCCAVSWWVGSWIYAEHSAGQASPPPKSGTRDKRVAKRETIR